MKKILLSFCLATLVFPVFGSNNTLPERLKKVSTVLDETVESIDNALDQLTSKKQSYDLAHLKVWGLYNQEKLHYFSEEKQALLSIYDEEDASNLLYTWITPWFYSNIPFNFIAFKILLNRYPGIFCLKETNTKTMLHCVTIQGQTNLVEALLKKKANVNVKDDEGKTPLHRAAINKDKDIVELLLQYKAEINIFDQYDYSPLSYAIINNDKDICKILLQNKAIISEKDIKNAHDEIKDHVIKNYKNQIKGISF